MNFRERLVTFQDFCSVRSHHAFLKELEKKFEVRLENMKKAQKKEVEKLEASQEAYFKSKTKKLKQEQVKRFSMCNNYYTLLL